MAVATKEYIESLRESRWVITKELEALILAEFSEEPDPHGWTDQDLYEQVRKIVNEYNAKHNVMVSYYSHKPDW